MRGLSTPNTRRHTWALRAVLAVVALTCAACTHASESPKPASLVGTLWWMTPDLAAQPIEAWRTELDAIQALGMDLLILNGPFVGQDLAKNTSDPLVPFFEELDRRGMRVYLDTLFASQWWTLEDPADEIARARKRIALLHERYGRFACFEGYYVPYELYVFWGDHADLIRALYRDVSAACKAVAPDKPV
ncbi:MAG: DUF4434 domain-containing protein, partial [bacterium]|nr:DUF4434 domain-containing protein [bacterium]